MNADDQRRHRTTHWPAQLASIGALRFARRSANYVETVRFYRELVGLPLFETFGESYGSNGAIFGLPSWNLTLEIVEATEAVAVDPHEQLCLYFPDAEAQQAAIGRLRAAGVAPVPQHPYWEAMGAITFRDPDGREVVFAPFVFGVNEPAGSESSGTHEFPAN
ncbi:glyoxalase [Mycobacterium sp. E2462]|uniref:VOC family protein n=1 Tax=unclassified Mycobacterium TaxID=2642494 RepID=UPI0007FC0DE9|nr:MULTISPECIES: VOC family protein [unclassified Mycobacterium]OBG78918.1 glyoxalase [Mycobacterium sp. E1214]OBH26919.1 glyoxalase [Mycobacterium sp. E1319]OBI16110.1 glyoxalase [Mycobacterium sp. E2462]